MTIAGQRGSAGDPKLINAAKSRVLARHLAPGCNFMGAYNAAEDPLTQAYLRSRGLEDSASNEASRFREESPQGDASSANIASSIVVAWVITIPASATVAALFYWLITLV